MVDDDGDDGVDVDDDDDVRGLVEQVLCHDALHLISSGEMFMTVAVVSSNYSRNLFFFLAGCLVELFCSGDHITFVPLSCALIMTQHLAPPAGLCPQKSFIITDKIQ